MPSTTSNQDREFKKTIVMDNLPDSMLEEAISFIGKNFNPEDVFDRKELISWAEAEGPDEIFKSSALEEWATDNGFVKES